MLGSASQTSTVETFASVSYLEGYLENAEYLPTELQYYITHYRELACQIKEIVADIAKYIENVAKSVDASQKKQAILQIQRCLIKQNELGDQKLNIMTLIGDLIESKIRDHDVDEHFDVQPQSITNNVSSLKEEEIASAEKESKSSAEIPTCPSTRSSSNKIEEKHDNNNIKRKRHGRHRSSTQEQICLREDDKKQLINHLLHDKDEDERPRKKKTRKDSKMAEKVPNFKIIGNIDPNEPVYCSCREVSYGEMIGCDNDNCAIEWFHFRCVELNHKPKGKWYCPTCRGDKSGVMNPELVEQQKRAKKNASALCSD